MKPAEDGVKTESPVGRPSVKTEAPPSEQKVYHFAWDDVDPTLLSDATVSSVHTSDLSSFDGASDDAAADADSDATATAAILPPETVYTGNGQNTTIKNNRCPLCILY